MLRHKLEITTSKKTMQRAIWAETCEALVGALIKIIINTGVTVKISHIKINTTVTQSRFTSQTVKYVTVSTTVTCHTSGFEMHHSNTCNYPIGP
jgi:uncharacterized membrane protein